MGHVGARWGVFLSTCLPGLSTCLPVYLVCLPVYLVCLPVYLVCPAVYLVCLPVDLVCLPVYLSTWSVYLKKWFQKLDLYPALTLISLILDQEIHRKTGVQIKLICEFTKIDLYLALNSKTRAQISWELICALVFLFKARYRSIFYIFFEFTDQFLRLICTLP